jgi:hypothetical protein
MSTLLQMSSRYQSRSRYQVDAAGGGPSALCESESQRSNYSQSSTDGRGGAASRRSSATPHKHHASKSEPALFDASWGHSLLKRFTDQSDTVKRLESTLSQLTETLEQVVSANKSLHTELVDVRRSQDVTNAALQEVRAADKRTVQECVAQALLGCGVAPEEQRDAGGSEQPVCSSPASSSCLEWDRAPKRADATVEASQKRRRSEAKPDSTSCVDDAAAGPMRSLDLFDDDSGCEDMTPTPRATAAQEQLTPAPAAHASPPPSGASSSSWSSVPGSGPPPRVFGRSFDDRRRVVGPDFYESRHYVPPATRTLILTYSWLNPGRDE